MGFFRNKSKVQLLGGLLAGPLVLVATVVPAYAAGSDESWMGGTAGTYALGVQATISKPNTPYVANVSGATSSDWVMLNPTSGSGLVQVGYYEIGNEPGNVYYFFQYQNSSGDYWTKYSVGSPIQNDAYLTTSAPSGAVGPATGSSHVYKVYDNAGVFVGTVDGTDWNGQFTAGSLGWTPNEIEYCSELHDYADARWFGSSSAPVNFTNLSWWDTSGVQHTSLTLTGDNGGINYATTQPDYPNSPDGGFSGILSNGTSSVHFSTFDKRS